MMHHNRHAAADVDEEPVHMPSDDATMRAADDVAHDDGNANTHGDGAATVHPGAAKLFHYLPCLPRVPVVGMAVEGYGPKLVSSLCLQYFLCKGTADQIIGYSRQPMLTKRFKLDALRYQRLASLWATGWSIKAFIAALTDTFAFLGYTKRWYMLLSCVLGACFSLGYGLLPAKESSGNIAGAFIFLTTLGKSNVDILSEGHYSRLMRRNPKPGPALVSCVWVCILTGTLVASVVQGPLSDRGLQQVGVFVSAALQLSCSIFFIFNWYGEKTNREERLQDQRDLRAALWKARLESGLVSTPDNSSGHEDVVKDLHPERNATTPLHDDGHEVQQGGDGSGGVSRPTVGVVAGDENEQELLGLPECDTAAVARLHDGQPANADDDDVEDVHIPSCLCGLFEVNTEVVSRNWRIVMYSAVMTCSVVSMVCVTILGSTWDLMYGCIVISVVCCGVAFYSLPLIIAKAQVFCYLNSLLYIQLPGALDNFYLADEACLPGGPHFSYSFYNTISAVIGNIGGICGVTLFTYIFSKMNYQVTMGITVSLIVLASVFDIIIVERWNLSIGIPDHAMYLCGDAVIYNICNMFTSMPTIILMARLCPRGSESMIYALLAGFSNFGQTMSNVIGSLLMETRWPVITSTTPCDFSNVRWLVITGHLCCPALIVPLSFLLLPRARICDDIDVNGHAIRADLKKEVRKHKKEEGQKNTTRPPHEEHADSTTSQDRNSVHETPRSSEPYHDADADRVPK